MSNITNIHNDSFHCHQYYKHYVTEAQVKTLILKNNWTKYKTLSEITRKEQQSNAQPKIQIPQIQTLANVIKMCHILINGF